VSNVLITGASRGLGLEFARQYAADGWRVFATCRDPDGAAALEEAADGSGGAITVHRLDVGDLDQIDALAEALAGEAVDVLLNNAGAFGDRAGFGRVDVAAWERTFRVNAIAPYRMCEAFVEHVARSEQKVVANVTSKMGSIADNTSGGRYVYRSSKAALNMVTASLAHDLAGRGIKAVVLHPGWVRTDMGGPSAPLEAPESVAGMRKVIAGLAPDQSGRFFNWDGAEIPW